MEPGQALANTPPFNQLDEKTIAELAKKLEYARYPKNTYVIKQNELPERVLYIVASGLLELVITNEKGERITVALRRPNELFGETGFLTRKEFPGSIFVVEDAELFLLHGEDFDELLNNQPEFAGFFSEMLADRMRRLYQEVIMEQSQDPLTSDSQPFRKRACDIMTNPVFTCHRDMCVDEVARIMLQNNISSIVVLGKEEKPMGIITEKSLVSNVVAQSRQASSLMAYQVMHPNPIMVAPDAFFYQVLLAMIKSKQKHILVVEKDRLIGILTPQNLIKSRSFGTLSMVSEIEAQSTIVGLNESRKFVDKVLKALVAEKAPPSEIFPVITEFDDRLMRKVIEISEKEMVAEGHGAPPAAYCFINMGSAGRKEQFLRTDQDNGIIYDDVPVEKQQAVAAYFQILADKIVEGLFQCGFQKCKGDVMATNPKWCQSFNSWRKLVKGWIVEPEAENVRMLTIFLDFRPCYGKYMLADLLKRYVIRTIQQTPIVLHHLAKDDLSSRVPLGIFRKFITEKSKEHKNEINLKTSACVHVVDCLRILSYRESILETATLERLKALTKKGIITKEDSEFIEFAYQSLMMFRIRENLRKLEQGLEPDNYINPYQLSKREQNVLKEAFLAVDQLQNSIGNDFMVESGFNFKLGM
ncbi:MAG: CBS domain-containing protein [Clostridia bacterium]|nr:CBS domain-containing protein [Clostridia bacterium]